MTNVVTKDRCDPNLAQRLKTQQSISEILSWMVSGAIEWYANGMRFSAIEPYVCEEQRLQYTYSCISSLQQFTDLFLEKMPAIDINGENYVASSRTLPKHRCSSTEIYNSYTTWCKKHNIKPISHKAFALEMHNMGYEKRKNGSVYYLHIRLKDEYEVMTELEILHKGNKGTKDKDEDDFTGWN